MQKLFIIDFDDTLFQTRIFWRKFLFPQLKKKGIPHDLLETVYIASTYKMFGYFIESLFLSMLFEACKEKDIKISRKELKGIFQTTVYSEKAKKYFFPGAVEFLKRVKKSGHASVLLSSGDYKFKTRFFKALGLGAFFHKASIHITKKPKVEFIRKLRSPSLVILVNDVLEETKNMMLELEKISPMSSAYLIDHQKTIAKRGLKKNIKIIHSFSEITFHGKI